ncbi:hypothetical protein N7462_009065 [Penicillium macrosclerotiorum]|uniref:uncharacterized protein n=1 Tax=Penicillium macrosclerotiorum TaxID=303699 RepID=UPI00254966B1|nr:uncharacterized protein N7462_009065 [Penicillium macrosclerotiorum]KAJ5676168.1 hypothetical protein N7462_009065 [Penicillium macrosclerotiorum]
MYPGATTPTTRIPLSRSAMEAGSVALKRSVLTGGWRDADYWCDPGRGSDSSVIRAYCDALEQIAREDPDFAQKYGTQFHRPCGTGELLQSNYRVTSGAADGTTMAVIPGYYSSTVLQVNRNS